MTQAHPLQWPAHIPRKQGNRSSAKFQVGFDQARRELYEELEHFGASKVVITSNMQLNLDGRPSARQPWNPNQAVAVYFDRKGQQLAFACDQYDTYLGNLRGVGLTLMAMRAIERHGGVSMVDAAFTGYVALPASVGSLPADVAGLLEVRLPRAVIEQNYRALAKQHHPDVGGDPDLWRAIQLAYERATALVTAS